MYLYLRYPIAAVFMPTEICCLPGIGDMLSHFFGIRSENFPVTTLSYSCEIFITFKSAWMKKILQTLQTFPLIFVQCFPVSFIIICYYKNDWILFFADFKLRQQNLSRNWLKRFLKLRMRLCWGRETSKVHFDNVKIWFWMNIYHTIRGATCAAYNSFPYYFDLLPTYSWWATMDSIFCKTLCVMSGADMVIMVNVSGMTVTSAQRWKEEGDDTR